MTPYEAARTVRLAVNAPWFTAPYDVNLFGLRRPWGPSREATDLFDDAIVLAVDGNVLVAAATTDPGRPYLARPMRSAGTAILVPGHYPSSHTLGVHKGYPALRQYTTLRVWRDATRDAVYDTGTAVDAGVECGINIHAAADDAAGVVSARVGRWSAGCQVTQRRSDLRAIVAAVEAQRRAGLGGTVSYTLVDVGALSGAAREAAYVLLGLARP